MKLAVGIVLLAALCTASCSENESRKIGGGLVGGATIWTDPETGCEYVFFKNANGGGLSIRYNEDGAVACPSA